MPRLALCLLGPPRLERDGEPVQVSRRKVIALLIYLAVTRQPQGREALATLLSPEFDTGRARNELRRSLSVLNRLLGAGCLIADRETVALNPDADLWLDVEQFRRRLAACDVHDHPPDTACPDCVPLLQEAVALYQDDFLVGFTLPDSLAFEEWGFFEREGLRQALAGALQRLVRWHSEREDYEDAIAHARRWLALDPLHEPAHRQLMQLYAQSGHPAAALRQYRVCLRVLEEELDVPPAAETAALYERIRAERRELAPPAPSTPSAPSRAVPAFLAPEEAPAEVEKEVFVTRERELAQLERYLASARAGQGQVVFVTGDPGRGKTALMREFARRAMDAHSDLLVATGNCNAYSGVGDPYLPFRQVIQMLTGDVEARWAAGAIDREHAQRLWAALPQAIQALLDHGAPLIDIFLPGAALLSRAAAAALTPGGAQAADDAGWLEQLREAIQREKPDPDQVAQSQLFEGYTRMLGALATQRPLLLILDDLQWTDSASVSLLFHLGRELASSHILIVGAYRAEEVALGRDGERHPLEKVLAEFKRGFGDVWLDLSGADDVEGRRFVEAFLDSEPNRLGEDFRGALFHHSGGHPLFTVELLRAMQERGDLIRDEEGDWVQAPALDWHALPGRVEGVIEERVGRLDGDLRDLLTSDYRGLVVTTMHKFDRIPKSLNLRENVVVLIDEAHRTQEGDLATYMRAALPHAVYFGFTGTPVDKGKIGQGTFETFGQPDYPGGYLDKYGIDESIEDGTTVRLYYTLAPSELRVDRDTLDKEFYQVIGDADAASIEEWNRLLDRAGKLKSVLKSDQRVAAIAAHVARHFTTNVEPLGFKAFLVGVDREACALYKQALDQHLPEVYSRAVYTPGYKDDDLLRQYHLDGDAEKQVRKAFRDPQSQPRILIVTQKLLTGYDAPVLYAMYLDKPLKDHTLLQAIARVNRPYPDKKSGLIVDYIGIFEDLQRALAFDQAEVSRALTDLAELQTQFATLLDRVEGMIAPINLAGDRKDRAARIIDHFFDPEPRETFIQDFKTLQTAYEILSPDPFLRDYMDRYALVTQVYQAVCNYFDPAAQRRRLRHELLQKTDHLIRERVDVVYLAEPLPLYPINRDLANVIAADNVSDQVKVINLYRSLMAHIEARQEEQPYLISIGEEVEAIIERLRQRQISAQAALQQVQARTAEAVEAEAEQRRSNLPGMAFAFAWVLRGLGVPEAGAEAQAQHVGAILARYPGWPYSAKIERAARIELYKTLKDQVPATQLKPAVDNLLKMHRTVTG